MTIHVVGAGLAGLAAAIALLEAGADVLVHEAAAAPGGRCRTYHDPVLDRRIDTGTHLLLGANRAALAYVRRLGAGDRMVEGAAAYAFFDVGSGARREIRPTPAGLVAAFRPVALAALNTEPAEASWPLLAAVFGRLIGESACRPWIARTGIGDALIAPAAARLGDRLRLGRRLDRLDLAAGRLRGLAFGDQRIALGARDAVVLAVPPWTAAALLPGLTVPTRFRAIVNGHFRVGASAPTPRLMALTGGLGQWLLWREDVVSVTVSAADALVDEPGDALAARFWPEVSRAFGLPPELPAWRIVKERRATVAATPSQERLRPGPRTAFDNLWLAGDWIRTGLPGTLEGAVRSGEAAARLALAQN